MPLRPPTRLVQPQRAAPLIRLHRPAAPVSPSLRTRHLSHTSIFEELRGRGETLQLQGTDTADEWFVTRAPEGVRWTPGQGKADVIVRGTAFDLLLAVYRRAPIDVVDVMGDESLVEHWIAHSSF